jgi:bisphosphoglycerate-independent phosphoglycerate mutase (AlkP superfamily)
MTERGHTRNPVPFIALGPKEQFLRDRVASLTDVTPALLAAFDSI